MEELGYHPNALARSLRRGETKTIGLIIPEISNPFFAEIGRSIEAAAFELGYNLILGNSEEDPGKESLYVNVFRERQVDGMILVPSGHASEISFMELLDEGQPLVIVDREIPGIQADVVRVDHRRGAYQATRYLIELGHRRIGCVAGPVDLPSNTARIAGYRDALAEANLDNGDDMIWMGSFHPGDGSAGVKSFLGMPDRPTAVFCCNDMIAVGALHGAHEAGSQVPRDLSIIGFDNIELASFIIPPLSTVAQPIPDLGRAAARLLIDRIADRDRPVRKEILPTRLVVRGTTAGPARAAPMRGTNRASKRIAVSETREKRKGI